MAGYQPETWFDLAVAVVGAAAALAGLLFVAMSINIERILAIPTLPARAAGNLVLFVVPLVVGIGILIPKQSTTALGLELLLVGLLVGGLLLWLHRPSNRARGELRIAWLLGSLVPSVMVALLTLIGGATLIAGQGGGLYWVAPAIVLAVVMGLAGAWVLLVEILR